MLQLYKVTAEGGSPYHGGAGKWSLPNGKAGKWRSVKGDLKPCSNGLHLCRSSDLLEWLGPAIWEAEHDGEIIECKNKVVVRRARLTARVGTWNDQIARLLAADCAERVLKIANDPRCDAAVLAARQYAFGLIDDAARTAARTAARAAVRAAARTAARDAAWTAARTAARAAVRAAAWDAAWAAARDAAWTAAWAAARDAAWGAAWDAAWTAAWGAARKWQEDRLIQYLTGKVDLNAIKALVMPKVEA